MQSRAIVYIAIAIAPWICAGPICALDLRRSIPKVQLPNDVKLDPVRKAELPIAELPPVEKTITGRFETRDGVPVFVTEGNGEFKVNVPISPSEIKAAYAGDVQLQVTPQGDAKLTPKVNTGLKEALNAVEKISGSVLRESISDDVSKLESRLDEQVPPGTTPKEKAARDFGDGAMDILLSFIKAPEPERKANLRTVGVLYLRMLLRRDQGGEKSSYGPDDNYPPESYPRIRDACMGVGAVRHSERVIGTAFHLGKNVVITAGHCLRRDKDGPELSTNQIDFCFATNPSSLPLDREVPFGRVILKGDYLGGEDFAIILAGDKFRNPESLGVPVLRWTDTPVSQYSSVFVIGYKEGGDMTVVDGAHVLFPHEFNEQEYNDLLLRLAGEMQMERWQANAIPIEAGEEENRKMELEILDEAHRQLQKRFEDSLRPMMVSTEEPPLWVLRSSFIKSPGMPAFGLDSNTFGGHSGGPVVNRHSFKVVGLFCRGMPDDPSPMRAGLERHEEAIPIMHILKAWKKKFPKGTEDFAPEKFGFVNIP